jgi:ribonuclease HII
MVSRATRSLERQLGRRGFTRLAGVDEVGRGCLAGPVLAAAVVLSPARHVPGLRDSKLLSALQRERCYDLITRRAAAWSVAEATVEEIDRVNIYRASLLAMRRAVLALNPLPDLILVDAVRIPDMFIAQQGVVDGDTRASCIAAASIIAKVTRDRIMRQLHEQDGRYGFDRHKGYATADHLKAVASFGYSSVHRRSFRPPTLFDTIDVD